MKYFILSLIFFYSCSNRTSSKDEITSQEIYYAINEDGTIDKSSITEIRKIIYNPKWMFLLGINDKDSVLTSDASKYYVLPLMKNDAFDCEYDSLQRITRFKEQLHGCDTTEHFLVYDNWGNLSEDKSICTGSNEQTSIVTYEYIYLDDFTYAQRDGIKFVSGTKSNYSNPWLIRTIKQNNKIVEYTERKIQNLL